jgi:hypothetical protein
MTRRIPLWAALSSGAAVLIGCGIFFAFQDLGTANDYATIASFFLALLIAIGSALSFVRSKQEPETAAPGEGLGQKSTGRSQTINNGSAGVIQNGGRNRFRGTINMPTPHPHPAPQTGEPGRSYDLADQCRRRSWWRSAG